MGCSTDGELKGAKQQHKSVNIRWCWDTCNPEIRSGIECERAGLRQNLKKR